MRKISKMSGEIEEGESYFLLRLTARNCVVEGAKRVRGKRGRGAKKHLASCY